MIGPQRALVDILAYDSTVLPRKSLRLRRFNPRAHSVVASHWSPRQCPGPSVNPFWS
ncbi:hypothetical protein BDV30DRAFT_216950 [Aspergillus minisclerotigenes]|uniref:Uncharacterized protein n=1 Tax=Aspergillus minisclerotigenes TaxID=656917 RepID=A0A5N6ISJ2_9EURO|nr:hypothetical protein BDV30DRAFT_216950 [Aspergillus minisclerotigenes]